MVQDRGGILSALRIFTEHEGAVGRDLAHAHWTWDDVWSGRFPFDQFIHFIVYAPAGTAVFHVLNHGWTADTHKVVDLIQWVKMLIAANSAEPEGVYRNLGEEWRPGQEVEAEQFMTVGEYMKRAGLEG